MNSNKENSDFRKTGWFVVLLLIFCGMPNRGFSQEKPKIDIVRSYNETVKAIGDSRFDASLQTIKKVLADYGGVEKGKKEFGAVYGHWFYLRGLAQMGKKEYKGAVYDFNVCYSCTTISEKVRNCSKCAGLGRVTPSSLSQKESDGLAPCPHCGGRTEEEVKSYNPNLFRMHALVQGGNCEMILEGYAEAAELYRKALAEDKLNRLSQIYKLYAAVNLGRCLIKSGKVDEGYNYVVRALDNPGFSASLKQSVFLILAVDWSPLVTADKIYPFLDKYAYIPLSDSYENRVARNSHFFKLAIAAVKDNDDPLLALRWNRLIAHPGPLITKYDATRAAYLERKKREEDATVLANLDKEIGRLLNDGRMMTDNLWLMMSSNGMSHFQLKNFGASYEVYSRLSDDAPKHKERPVFLHNAVVSAVQIDNWEEAYHYGKMFLKEFPKHRLKPNVVRILVEVIFLNGDYQEAYDIAIDVREDMEPGSEIRDIPDFVVGASAYMLGRASEANDELTAYLENYPQAQRKEPARYFLGSSKVVLYRWQEGTDIFDPFLSDYPGSSMTSSVLYQNGLCKFMVDDNAAAKPLVKRLLTEFPGVAEVPKGWNLLGDITSTEEASFTDVIRPAYLKGKETSSNFSDQQEVAAYAIWQLMMNAASNELWEEAAQYFDEFQESHPGSAYRVDMLIGGLPTLVEVGRTDEAIKRQVELLYETGGDPQQSGLGELFATFLDFIKDYDTGNKDAHIEELAVNSKSSVALKNWAIIGKIQLLEESGEEGGHEDEIDILFHRINSDFDPARNSNYVIVRLARWHAKDRNKSEDAAPLYDFVIDNRPGTDDYDFALLDRAQIDAASQDPGRRKQAMANFDRVLNEYGTDELAEDASVGVARLLTEDRNYDAAYPRWEAYMDNSGWNKYSAEANYSYGLCLDKAEKIQEALVVYINTYNAFPGHADYSTPSYLRAAHIMKERGEDLKALLILRDMLTRLKNIEHPNMDEGLVLYKKWIADYKPQKKK